MSRTTLDLDRDVLQALKRLALESSEPMTRVANRVVRLGLAAMRQGDAALPAAPPTAPADLGNCRVPVDDVSEALAIAEGDWHR